MRRRAVLGMLLVVTVALVGHLAAQAPPQASTLDWADLQRVRGMLKDARDAVKEHYYDPAFHGVDLEVSYKEFESQLKTAPSLNVGMTIVAAFLERFHDSHVFLIPPPRPYTLDYGYRMRAIGDAVFVSGVKPGSDADGKVRPGDQVLLVNNGRTSRSSFHTMSYLLSVLQPQPSTQLVVRDPQGSERTVLVKTEMTNTSRRSQLAGSAASVELEEILREARDERLLKNRGSDLGDVFIWQMPSFMGTTSDMDAMFDKAKGHGTLILDLRGNGGGLVTTLDHVIGRLFTNRIIVGQRTLRKRKVDMNVDGRKDAFTGRVIVLIDSASASASEILARVVQLEHRGTVIGDRSAGMVMESMTVLASQGTTMKVFYGFSVTVADLIMRDGVSLEGKGVVPDETLLPTGQDLSLGRDPVLSRAAKLAGLDLDPVAAGKLFPFEWK